MAFKTKFGSRCGCLTAVIGLSCPLGHDIVGTLYIKLMYFEENDFEEKELISGRRQSRTYDVYQRSQVMHIKTGSY